jgi:hypothetical protein
LKILYYSVIASVAQRVLGGCVFFAQHIVEKRHEGLWEWPFFIA